MTKLYLNYSFNSGSNTSGSDSYYLKVRWAHTSLSIEQTIINKGSFFVRADFQNKILEQIDISKQFSERNLIESKINEALRIEKYIQSVDDYNIRLRNLALKEKELELIRKAEYLKRFARSLNNLHGDDSRNEAIAKQKELV